MAKTPKGTVALPRAGLDVYRAKRSLDRSPEPAGSVATPGRTFIYVVQKHAATRMHYDLRLEHDGVLRSFAVPKGPSLDPKEKRLAVQVEDHPLTYVDFEGRIPKGNYGAGAMIVWDRGQLIWHEDPTEGRKKGKLLFELQGHKLHGLFTLVLIKSRTATAHPTNAHGATSASGKNWLLIKKPDAWARPGELPDESILSGLTVQELGRGEDREARVVAALKAAGAPVHEVKFDSVKPMLCQVGPAPFSDKGWVFEIKWDGYRMMSHVTKGKARLASRNGHDYSATFPEIRKALAALPISQAIFDGEIVALGPDGAPRFGALAARGQLKDSREIAAAAQQTPVHYVLFDLLACAGRDLRKLPLLARKKILAELVPSAGPLRLSQHIAEKGDAMFSEIERLGLEGLIAKRATSLYEERRSGSWLKIRAARMAPFVVVGFTPPKGGRKGLGALELARFVGGALRYAGRVGTGFDQATLASLEAKLEDSRVEQSPLGPGPQPPDKLSRWVSPALVVTVRFTEITQDGRVRHGVFQGARDDLAPADCADDRTPIASASASASRAGVSASSPASVAAPASSAAQTQPRVEPSPKQVVISHPDKMLWPEDGVRKCDLAAYYRGIAPWMLPYTQDRLLVMTRYPDGIHGKSFFQKDTPAFLPAWARTERIWSEGSEREINYLIADETPALELLANMAALVLHVWGSRWSTLSRPDWCILDLDPKEAPFGQVVEIAIALKKLCDKCGLPAYVKTSGQKGLHVLVPLGGQCTFEQCRHLAEIIAAVVVKDLPDIATTERVIGKRNARVYIDTGQNGHGRLLVAPFSTRPIAGAPVSFPLTWKEVNQRLDPRAYTVATAAKLMAKRKTDPLLPVLSEAPNLLAALGKLQSLL